MKKHIPSGPSVRLSVASFLIPLLMPFAAQAAIPAAGDWPAVKVIDMHTHVFNARDLPLTGVLNALGAPRPVAVVVTEAILASMKEDDSEARREITMAEVERPTVTPLSESQRNILFDYVGKGRSEALGRAAAHLKVEPDATLLAETLAKIGFPPDDRLDAPLSPQGIIEPEKLGGALKGYLRFIGIMTKQHGEIVAALQASYPQADLFVHHMMDMAAAYDDAPTIPFSEQVAAMQKLDEAHPGKLLHFTAFDPFRRGGALALAQKARNLGAVGLKIYPPSGYRAAENKTYKFPEKPTSIVAVWEKRRWNSRYAGWKEEELDKTLQGAFAWAAKGGIPIFTHCTPKGFEAVSAHGNTPGYGMMADPFFWAAALKKKENTGLRLCFGHSGGEAYWFSNPADDPTHKTKPPGDAWQFGKQVIDLCLTYPDVFCEVGYLDGILDPKQSAALVRRLQSVINLPSKDGKWRFGDKLMYGTDWHMIYKETGYDQYLAKWDEVIKQVGKSVDGKMMKGGWRGAFFAGNARNFLRLEQLAKDPRLTPAQRRELGRLSGAIRSPE